MLLFAQPQPHSYFHQASPRERYLHALSEEKAARDAYVRDLANQYHYGALPHYHHQYDDIREAQAREHLRLKQLEALRAQQIQAERQRQQKAMESERRRLILESRRRAEQERQDAFANYRVRMVNAQQERDELTAPRPSKSTSTPIQSRPLPTWQQKQDAATTIQAAFRMHILRKKALENLSSIRDSFNALVGSFSFPSDPEFDASSNLPRLLYSATNAPIHAFEDSMIKLLSKLDEIESGGDPKIRHARKALATEVEGVLEGFDKAKVSAWQKWKDSQVPSEWASVSTDTDVTMAIDSGGAISSVDQAEGELHAKQVENEPHAFIHLESDISSNSTTGDNNINSDTPSARRQADLIDSSNKSATELNATPESATAPSQAPAEAIAVSVDVDIAMVTTPQEGTITTIDPADSEPCSTPREVEMSQSEKQPLVPNDNLDDNATSSANAADNNIAGDSHEASSISISTAAFIEPNEPVSSPSRSPTPSLEDTFLGRALPLPISETMLSLPILNDSQEMKEVEDIVLVETPPNSVEIPVSDEEDFVVVDS